MISKEKLKSFHIGRKTILYIHLSLLLLMLSLFLNAVIQPLHFSYFGLVALTLPILIICYLFLLLVWLLYKKWIHFLVFGLLLTLFIIPMRRYVNWSEETKDFTYIKVASFNTRYAFDMSLHSIENYFTEENANIVFLQEIYTRQWRDKETFMTERYNAIFPYVGISSTYPIIASQEILLPENGHSCYADILIGNDTIRAINVYLEPMYINKKILEIKTRNEIDDKGIMIKNKILQGFKMHNQQLNIIQKYVDDSPYPIILGGDLNSVPNSYEYYTFEKRLNDSFYESGNGLGTSFHDYYYPLRLDYIFYSDEFSSSSYKVDRTKKYSDHFPVSVYLKLNPKTEIVSDEN